MLRKVCFFTWLTCQGGNLDGRELEEEEEEEEEYSEEDVNHLLHCWIAYCCVVGNSEKVWTCVGDDVC